MFTVGDRITIGGVRGDVVALGFIQTSGMEMGEPPGAHSGDPTVWVNARQYTGRVVNVTNDKLFDTPVFNYTREFPFLWTDNWLEVSLRFLAPVRGVRALKDAMTRDILPAFDRAKIGIASTTFELTGMPEVRVRPVA